YEILVEGVGEPAPIEKSPAEESQSSLSPSDNGVYLVSAVSQDESDDDTTLDSQDQTEEPAAETGVEQTAGEDSSENSIDVATPVEADAVEISSDIVSKFEIQLGIAGQPTAGEENQQGAAISEGTLKDTLVLAGREAGIPLTSRVITVSPVPVSDGEQAQFSEWNTGSQLRFMRWSIELPLDGTDSLSVLNSMQTRMNQDPVWVSSSAVGSRVAGDMIGRAFGALFASILCIIGYIWFRFQRVIYGFAAVAALIHDVLITRGAIAVSAALADYLGFQLIDPFKISLTVVAAILTIIGYSLNDTIVVFDRIRETKGKATKLTGEMINSSINMTLSRTLLTSLTTLIVVVLLYCFGGEGIHAFAFALVVGVLVGTYSSIFIASPILLWLIRREDKATA
ncbi:MAG: protein translocase subunit SecF, partial [Planctomycetota bacterium]|nr:protein translocase subunit SecF [Planctomycetota bacterium]